MAVGSGTLFIVATPIGNLNDISPRARKILASVALIAAEDTRRTAGLLTHFDIHTRLVSCHEHNEADRVPQILEHLQAGEDVALVSDAGTPLLSDPGYRLLAAARERSIPVSPVPGCSAIVAAMSVAGLPGDRFRFEGFLPASRQRRRSRLIELSRCAETMVLFESVHRINDALADLADIFGADRPAALCRELTKLHETVYRGSLGQLPAELAADTGGHKGEFTIVVAGCVEPADPDQAELERILGILLDDLPVAQAAALVARITGVRRRRAYRLALDLQQASGGDGPD